jgi:ribose transport system substrate-binding protein
VTSPHKRIVGLISVAGLIAITGCSSGAASGGTGSSSGAGASALSSCVSQAKKNISAVSAPIPLKAPPSSFAMKKNAGKTIWLVSATQDEFNQTVANGFIAAAKAAGMTGRYVQANGQVNQMGQLVQEAVSAKAGGIVLFNIDPHSVSGQLSAARAAHIPVIDFNNGNPTDPLEPGIYAHVADDFTAQGKDMADWMLVNSGCKLDLATFELPTYPIDADLMKATIAEVHALCPSCKVTNTNFDLATFATTLGPLAQTVARRDPHINYMDPGFDAFAGIINPVLQQTGSKIKIVGHDGSASNLAAMSAHRTLQVMTDATPPELYIGWVLVDELGRGMLGLPAANWALPARLVDSSNIGNGTVDAIFPTYTNFNGVFLKAWGVG